MKGEILGVPVRVRIAKAIIDATDEVFAAMTPAGVARDLGAASVPEADIAYMLRVERIRRDARNG